jgi:hypothetical protein
VANNLNAEPVYIPDSKKFLRFDPLNEMNKKGMGVNPNYKMGYNFMSPIAAMLGVKVSF